MRQTTQIHPTIHLLLLLVVATVCLLALMLLFAVQPVHAAGADETTPTNTIVYTVVRGDTLWGISRRFGATVASIVQLNHIRNPNLIFAGQRLIIPMTAAPLWPEPPQAIELFSPLINERYRSPIDVNGFSKTFEGNVYLRLLNANGEIIGQHRARGGMSEYDFFHGYLRFEVTQEMSATLEVYEAAAPHQPAISSVQIPIMLEPGQRLIDLNTPLPGAKICGRVPVAGYSNTFEANVVVELTARDGSELEQTYTLGGGMGVYREFATTFAYTAAAPRAGLVGATEVSARDGALVDHVRVPVSLYPAGSSACR